MFPIRHHGDVLRPARLLRPDHLLRAGGLLPAVRLLHPAELLPADGLLHPAAAEGRLSYWDDDATHD